MPAGRRVQPPPVAPGMNMRSNQLILPSLEIVHGFAQRLRIFDMVHPDNGAVPIPYWPWLQSILGFNFESLQLIHQVVSGHLVREIPQHHGRPHLRVDSRSVVAKARLYDFSAVVTEEAPILVTSQ